MDWTIEMGVYKSELYVNSDYVPVEELDSQKNLGEELMQEMVDCTFVTQLWYIHMGVRYVLSVRFGGQEHPSMIHG